MNKKITNAKIACLDFSLNKEKMKLGIQVLVNDPSKLEAIRQREADITKVLTIQLHPTIRLTLLIPCIYALTLIFSMFGLLIRCIVFANSFIETSYMICTFYRNVLRKSLKLGLM